MTTYATTSARAISQCAVAATLLLGANPAPAAYVPPAAPGPMKSVALPTPPQDQGLPYTRTAHAFALARIKGDIALYAGSRYAYVYGRRVRLDNTTPERMLHAEAVARGGSVYVPEAFLPVLALKKVEFDAPPPYLEYRWVYTITDLPAQTEVPSGAAKREIDGHTYVDVIAAAKAYGYHVQTNARGLVLISRQPVVFDDGDHVAVDGVVTLFDTPDKLADPDVATAYIPQLKAQGKWTDHVKVTAEQLKLLDGPETQWPITPESAFEYTGFNRALLGSAVPKPGVYPRLLFSPEDVPMLYKRLQSNKLGQRTLVEWDVMFHKDWWDPSTSDGQIFQKLASGDGAGIEFAPLPDGRPLFMRPQTIVGHKPGIHSSHVNYVTNCLTTMALYCLLTGDEQHGRQAATALVTYYKLVEPMVDRLNSMSDSELGVADDLANYSESGWRGMSGLVNPMDLAFALDFGGKFMTPGQRDGMRRFIVKATYGKRDNNQAAPARWKDVNWTTWHLTDFLAQSAIEGLPGADPEVLQAGRETTRAFCDWGIDENGQIFESNGKNGGGIQFQILSMITLARRGLNLWGHPHFRKLLTAQAYATAPNGETTVSSGTWGSSPFSFQATNEIKAFYPGDLCADWLLTNAFPDMNLETFDLTAWRAQLEKSFGRNRLDGPTYCALTFGGLYNTDWKQVSRQDLNLARAWNDPVHGVFSASSSAASDATWLFLHVRSNQYIGAGHHHADSGMFYMSSMGVNWFTESPFVNNYEGKFFSEVLIDGLAEPEGLPARGTYLGAKTEGDLSVASCDITRPYSWQWSNQFLHWEPQGGALWDVAAKKTWELETDDPLPLSVYRGTQHYKMRPWWPSYNFSNWVPVLRSPWNPVQYALRTAGVVSGKHSYAVVADDLKKDGADHLYQWCAMLGAGIAAAPIAAPTSSSTLLARASDISAGVVAPGAPMLLVHVVAPGGDPKPAVDPAHDGPADKAGKPQDYDRLTAGITASEAHFRVLLIPVRSGEPLPRITASSDGASAAVAWPDQTDQLTFTSATGVGQSAKIGLSRKL